jgi:hypothetical protein
MKALTFRNLDSDVLEYIDIPAPAPKDEILVEMRDRFEFADVYRRSATFKRNSCSLAGYEGAGRSG